jgi:hypothetical protein
MNDGRVLITGGINESATLDSALLYDPNGQNPRKLIVTGTMTGVRSNHTSTTLADGKVLLTGGELSNGQLLKSSELYDPATGLFTTITRAMSIPRSKHTATLLPDGRVLLVGGKTADLYDPVTQTYTPTIGTPTNRQSHASLLLPDGTVLITGESGTGKELVARAIHHFSHLSERMFLPVNCGAIPEHLLESQLFGHLRGSFTGAINNQEGLFARARGGTIFLDEIGDLPLDAQLALLRVLQEREFERVGSTRSLKIDVGTAYN